MKDFKKGSLIENYNRITRAKNERLNEHGYYLGGDPIKEETEDVVNKDNVVDYIMQYEGGELDAPGTLQLFSYLVKTGQAWSLQGAYGRAAKSIIDAGYLDQKGNILKNIGDDDGADGDVHGSPDDVDYEPR